jgi:hypothetical protein
MADFTKIASKTFTAQIVREYSAVRTVDSLGSRKSTMDLYFRKDATGFIEWDIPAIDECNEIGLWFEIDAAGVRTLSDYDGLMSLPVEAVDMLKEHGVIVPDEFDDRLDQ